MNETPDAAVPPKKKGGKTKKIAIFGIGGLALVGGGVSAGVYASGAGMIGGERKHEDPRRPKLVLRNPEATQPTDTGTGDDKKAPRRIGTIDVAKDDVIVDPRKYEVAYYPIEQNFTANLAEGGGFAQLGLSVSTYFDSRVGDNLARQSVAIRSAILMVMSDQQAAVLSTPEGKHLLQRQLTKAINQVLREKEGFGGIDNVYFTNLVVQ